MWPSGAGRVLPARTQSTLRPDAALMTSPAQLRARKLTAIKRLLRGEGGHLEHAENNYRGRSAETAKGWSDHHSGGRAETPNAGTGRVSRCDALFGRVRPPAQARPIQKRAIR